MGIEQNIGVSRLKNGKIALSIKEGKKQLIFELGSKTCNDLIDLLKSSHAAA